jgi:hypothetical protein
MLLVPMAKGQSNFFEQMIKNLLENRKMHVAAFVCEYDANRCLLSDRGFSQPVADGPHMAFSFNLCATAFVDYIFADPATRLLLREGRNSARGTRACIDHRAVTVFTRRAFKTPAAPSAWCPRNGGATARLVVRGRAGDPGNLLTLRRCLLQR